MLEILTALNLQEKNLGACSGPRQWAQTQDQGVIDSINPYTETSLAQTYQASARDCEQLIQQAHSTFLRWRTLPAPKRALLIRALADKIREKKDLLGQLIALETGKIKQEALGEVQEMIDIADFAVGQSRMLYGKTMPSERPQHRLQEQWHPYGVVGIITAFNFPMAVWSWNAFIAAVAGNTVLWKPSSKTPLCALALQHLCNEVMEAHQLTGVFSVLITQEDKIKQQLVSDPRIPLISFTGSSAVGRQVNETVCRRMGRCILECSGNNAVIVDETAHLSLAIPAVLFGAIGTAGQRCTTTRRLWVHASIQHTFCTALVKAYQKIHLGDPLDPATHLGPLIDHKACQAFAEAIKQLKALGARILAGGQVLQRRGYFVEPTLVVEARNEWDIIQQETFAPILSIFTFNDLADAIHQQNDVPQGLSSAIFTNNFQHAEQFLSVVGSDCGIANVNVGTSGAEIGGAFGGEKATGGGRESGSDAWKGYMRRQTSTINWSNQLPLAQGIDFQV